MALRTDTSTSTQHIHSDTDTTSTTSAKHSYTAAVAASAPNSAIPIPLCFTQDVSRISLLSSAEALRYIAAVVANWKQEHTPKLRPNHDYDPDVAIANNTDFSSAGSSTSGPPTVPHGSSPCQPDLQMESVVLPPAAKAHKTVNHMRVVQYNPDLLEEAELDKLNPQLAPELRVAQQAERLIRSLLTDLQQQPSTTGMHSNIKSEIVEWIHTLGGSLFELESIVGTAQWKTAFVKRERITAEITRMHQLINEVVMQLQL